MKFEVFWKNPGAKTRPELRTDINCDYLIVGGGISGVSTAYALAKHGAKNIVLVDKYTVGSGATGQAAGTLVMRAERELLDLIKEYGHKKAADFWEQTHQALREIKNIADDEAMKCEYEVMDTLACGFKRKTFGDIRAEYAAEKKLEPSTKFLEGDALKAEINSPLFDHGMLSSEHGFSVNPLKFIQKFSEIVEKHGVKIYENTKVIRTKDGQADTEHGKINYKKIIWAIDSEHASSEIKNLKTTIIVTRPLTATEIERTGFAKRRKIVWDSRKNENYFKLTHDNRLLVGFGGVVVHKKNKQTDPHHPHLKQLQTFVKKLFPYLDLDIEYAWSGHFGVRQHYSSGPLVHIHGNEATIAGCGSQVFCYMAAKHVANKLMSKPSALDGFWNT